MAQSPPISAQVRQRLESFIEAEQRELMSRMEETISGTPIGLFFNGGSMQDRVVEALKLHVEIYTERVFEFSRALIPTQSIEEAISDAVGTAATVLLDLRAWFERFGFPQEPALRFRELTRGCPDLLLPTLLERLRAGLQARAAELNDSPDEKGRGEAHVFGFEVPRSENQLGGQFSPSALSADQPRVPQSKGEPDNHNMSGYSAINSAVVETDLPELPLEFQASFEMARAQAELNFCNRGTVAPSNAHYTNNPIHNVVLIQTIVLAYCAEARRACREGRWTVTQASRSSDKAMRHFCTHYFVREHGETADVSGVSKFVTGFRRAMEQDDSWKQHLSELIDLSKIIQPTMKREEAEDVQAAPVIVPNADEVVGSRPLPGHSPATVDSSVPPHAVVVRRYGFEAKMDRHGAIADTIGQYDTRWKVNSRVWSKESTLTRICGDLDERGIEIPGNWKEGTTASLSGVPLKDWTDALDLGYKKLIIDQIRYSLGMVLKTTSRTPDDFLESD